MAIFSFDSGGLSITMPAKSGLIINAAAPPNSAIISIGAWLDKYANSSNFWISSQQIEANGERATIVVYNNSTLPVDVYGNVVVEANSLPNRPHFTHFETPDLD